jgi:hypothetical protein
MPRRGWADDEQAAAARRRRPHICKNVLRKYRAVLRLEVEDAISSDFPIVLNNMLATLNASKEVSRDSCSHAG